MSAPERIWAIPSLGGDWGDGLGMWWPEDTRIDPQAEYVRADLYTAALAEIARLREELATARDRALDEAEEAVLPSDDFGVWQGSWFEPALREAQSRIRALKGSKP